MTDYALLEIGLHLADANWYRAEPRLWLPGDDAEHRPPPAASLEVEFDLDQLGRKAAYDDAYGTLLTNSLFGAQGVRTLFDQARALQAPLRLRLYVGASAPALHDLRWETLRDPGDPDTILALDENVLLSRYLSSWDWRPVRLKAKADLKALVVVANPTELAQHHMAEVDVAGELERARAGLAEIPMDALCRCENSRCAQLGVNVIGLPTLGQIESHLHRGYNILYLVAHGALVDEVPKVWLEDAEGNADIVRPDGPDGLVIRLAELPELPRLVILASCQSAGEGPERVGTDGGALSALGPRLAEKGVPAVVAMQGSVSMTTVANFMPRFFEALREVGQIEAAMAIARRAVRGEGREDWWMPTLFTRLHSGCLWYEPAFVQEQFSTWPDLVEAIRTGRCTPIVGPGLIEFLLGSPHDVARRWADVNHFPMSPQAFHSLPHVARYLATMQSTMYPPSLLERHLREEIWLHHRDKLQGQPPEAPLSELISAIGRQRRQLEATDPYQVLAQLGADVYINANPDDLLFDTLVEAGRHPQRAVSTWNEQIDRYDDRFLQDVDWRPSRDEPLIYHLFGHLGLKESLVISEDDYMDYLVWVSQQRKQGNAPSEIPTRVRGAWSRNALLFLGFEIDDWIFRVLLQSIGNRGGGVRGRRFKSVAVQMNPDQSPYLDYERACRYLEKYLDQFHNLNLYWGTAQDFVRDLWDRRQEWQQ
jgi:hypothetical protein